MARQARHDADYFPFIVKEGKTLFILESKYGLQGIGFFTNLMRFLTRQPDHHVCVQEESDRIYFFAQLHCPEDIGMDMLGLMVKTGKIDAQLWTEKRVIVSVDLIDSLQGAYKNRINKIITIEQIRVSYHNKSISYPDNTTHAGLSPEIEGRNPQTKLKDTKLKESIDAGLLTQPVDNSTPPSENQEPEPDAILLNLREIIEDIGTRIKEPKKMRQVTLFVEANIKGKNHSAIIHCLKSLQKQLMADEKIEVPRAYLEAALKIEDGKHNARDHEVRALEFRKPVELDPKVKALIPGIGSRASP